MNRFVRKFLLNAALIVGSLFAPSAILKAQSVFDPNDPIVVYNRNSPPEVPTDNKPHKWVKTTRLSWNTSSFKAYIYKGIPFRLKFPKSYDPSGAKKYPLYLFFHGKGERGSVYDNEYQLYHGGQHHMNAVDNGKFDGFLLYPQTSNDDGTFSTTMRQNIAELIEKFLIPEVNVDPFRVVINGLSLGGYNTWQFYLQNPKLVAAAAPISSASSSYYETIVVRKFTPVWLFQGGKDLNPPPTIARYINDKAKTAGSNFTYTEYPNEGHGCWNTAWNEKDYFPFLMRAHKANPFPVFGRTEFCEFGGPFNTTIGVEAGFDQYEWKKDDVVIAGATSNTLTVTSIGTYSCRIRKGTTWSPWSPIPVVIKYKTSTQTPQITVRGMASRVLPSPDGNTTVDLEVPGNFESYSWKKVGESAVISTSNVLPSAGVGSYTVQAMETFGCESANSAPFSVINANGPNKPAAPSNLLAIPMSYTSVKLAWTGSAGGGATAPTNFEIYQSSEAGGPYKFAAIVPGDQFTMTNEGLTPGQKYYFIVRAVNNTAGSPVSNEASATTLKDDKAPEAPSALRVTGSSRTSISLTWNESSDDVGIKQYEIFIDGVKMYVTSATEYTINNLTFGQKYLLTVRAVDVAGNNSTFSNQVTYQPRANGLAYKHYVTSTPWESLPNFDLLTPVSTGTMSNVSIDGRSQNENYAYMWQGYIKLPLGGQYYFRTTSADGSRLYLSEYSYTATPVVDNDGVHGTRNVNSTAGQYSANTVLPITVTYFQKNSGNSMSIWWRVPGSTTYTAIPDSVFVESPPTVAGSVPASPTNLTAIAISYKRINLNWAGGNNATKFELFRSTDSTEGFITIAVLPANTTSFADTLVQPNTRYYYKIRAINQYGESAFDRIGPGVQYSYYELGSLTKIPNFTLLNPIATGNLSGISLGVKQRNLHYAIKFEAAINLPASGTYTFYLKSDDGTKLFIDDVMLVDHDGAHNNTTEKSGSRSLTAGKHKFRLEYFNGASSTENITLNWRLTNASGNANFSKKLVTNDVFGEPLAAATTLAPPPAPQTPSGLTVKGITSSSIRINWTPVPANATAIELYRSFNDNSTYVLLATLPPTANVYLDGDLYPSSLFYYKIRAVGEGGESEYSDEKSAMSLGVIPTIVPIEDVYMRHTSTKIVPIEANAGSPTAISLSVTNLPPFAQLDSVANGRAILTFNPTSSQQGVYTMTVVARNPQNNTYTSQFKLTVNANYVPKIAAIPNQSVNEKQTRQVSISATDNDATDQLTWSLGSNTPSFVSIIGNNRNATVSLTPGYSDAGVYRILVVAKDGKNGKDTTSFQLTVVNVNTNVDDGSAPTKVRDLTGSFVSSLNAVRLTWTNTAYNALRNEVYRSTSMTGPFTLLNPGVNNKDSVGFTDNTSAGNKTYYYLVKTINNNGSDNSSTISINVPNRLPIISVDKLFAKSSTVTNIPITATDDPGEAVSLSVSGLPAFASFSPTGNGVGTLQLNPTSSHIGVHYLQLIATDSYGGKASKTIKLTITNKFITTTYININKSIYPVDEPWNNVNAGTSINASTTMTNLKTETGDPAGMNFRFIDGFNFYESGPIIGNDAGVFPDNVMKVGIQTGGDSRAFEILFPNGAPAGKRYNVLFYSNRNSNSSQLVSFQIGAQVVTLEMAKNTGNVARINNVTPVNDKIEIKMLRVNANATLNAVMIEEYDAATNGVFPPTGLGMLRSSKNSITLKWANTSTGVTGYEIWRSATANGTFTKLPGTIGANAFNYTDAGLTAGTTYYYKIRSVLASGYSEFSDVLKASTVLYSVSVNFNDGSNVGPASPAPWNNTNMLVYEGYTLPNLVNDMNVYTGIGMTLESNLNAYSGTNRQDNTLTTGNNSGAVPDAVMSTFYFLEYTHVGKIRITGLNKSLRYNFLFFAGCKDRGVPQLTTYTIGDENVILDAKNNTQNFAAINNVESDEDGSVQISLTASAQGGFGYIGAFIIQAVNPDGSGSGGSSRKAENNKSGAVVSLSESNNANAKSILLGAYPNPFVDDVTLKFSLKKPEANAMVVVRDMTGRPVFTKTLNNLPAGESNQKIGITGRRLAPGVYSVQVELMSNNERAIIKILK